MVAVLCRSNRTSARWQQFGMLCDLVELEGAEAAYYEELPVGYVHESRLGTDTSYFTITLEYGYGHDRVDSFDVSTHLHPVVRHYRRGALIAQHHVSESPENAWTGQLNHREPLRAFFARELTLAASAPSR
jgi:hypothetical protein